MKLTRRQINRLHEIASHFTEINEFEISTEENIFTDNIIVKFDLLGDPPDENGESGQYIELMDRK